MELTQEQSELAASAAVSPTEIVKKLAAWRLDPFPTWVLLIQAFIGLGWLRAGVEKLIDPTWWSGEYLEDFITEQSSVAMPWYEQFLSALVEPNVVIISAAVMLIQFAIAACLLSGRGLKPALVAGMFLNLNFIAAGAVTPSAFYLLAQGAVLLWLYEQSRQGADRRTLEMTLFAGASLVGLSVPWIRTIDPAEVIHDPAIMLATAGGLAAAMALELGRRSPELTQSRTPVDR